MFRWNCSKPVGANDFPSLSKNEIQMEGLKAIANILENNSTLAVL